MATLGNGSSIYEEVEKIKEERLRNYMKLKEKAEEMSIASMSLKEFSDKLKNIRPASDNKEE